MATSSAMSTTNDKIQYKVTITQNSQSVANNTSNVTVSVRVYRTNTGYTTYGTTETLKYKELKLRKELRWEP
jgi:predicted RNase H-related nuclease YkuK (DUF458 family)